MEALAGVGVARSGRGLGWRATVPLRPIPSAALGAGVALITAALYSLGSAGSLDWDGSVTVGGFVKTDSLLDPLKRTIQYNNHPLFSLLEHVVWSTGNHTEAALRVAPIAFGALTVGVLTAWCARGWGSLAGLSAGTLVAANPMFAELSRNVRGYSLLSFCAVVSTMLLWRLLAPTPRSSWVAAAYVLTLGAGIATHFYACLVLLAHVAIVLARRRFDARWIRRWLAGLALGMFIGAAAFLNIAREALRGKHGSFQGGFPHVLAKSLLGDQPVAMLAVGILVAWALWSARGRREILIGLGAILMAIMVIWAVVRPQFLFPRFLVFLVPAVAFAAAAVVARQRYAVLLVVVAVLAMFVDERPNWGLPPLPTAEAAALVEAGRAAGVRVCGYEYSGQALLAYIRPPPPLLRPSHAAGCDIVIAFELNQRKDRGMRAQFPYAWRLPAQSPGYVYSRLPQTRLVANVTEHRVSLEKHPRTYP